MRKYVSSGARRAPATRCDLLGGHEQDRLPVVLTPRVLGSQVRLDELDQLVLVRRGDVLPARAVQTGLHAGEPSRSSTQDPSTFALASTRVGQSNAPSSALSETCLTSSRSTPSRWHASATPYASMSTRSACSANAART